MKLFCRTFLMTRNNTPNQVRVDATELYRSCSCRIYTTAQRCCQSLCSSISTVNSLEILWCDKIKYLGIDLIAARVFKCSYDNAKRKFYRAFNAVFGNVGRTASIQLFKTICLPVLYYGLEVCPVNRDQVRSLDYAVHSCFKKTLAKTDQSVVEQCMIFFECHHVQDTMGERKRKFLH